MKDKWNERFARPEYAYGENPNEFLRESLRLLKPGSILFPADGEGRNGVYAATQGWKVTSFDISEEGRKKALKLAEKHKVTINYQINSFELFEADAQSFDALALIYAHLPEKDRRNMYRKMMGFLKPGGAVIFEAYHKTQLGRQSGGPQDINWLIDHDELLRDFEAMKNVRTWVESVRLNEGTFHQGEAVVVRALGKK